MSGITLTEAAAWDGRWRPSPPQDQQRVTGTPPEQPGVRPATGIVGSSASGSASPDSGKEGAWTPELKAELEQASAALESATPQEILAWGARRFLPRLSMGTAFGPEGMCLIHMLAEVAPQTAIFNLETGYQFPETLALAERVQNRYGIAIEFCRPDLDVESYEKLNNGPLYTTDSDRCCFDRKIKVLQRVASRYDAWISAIRRDQGPDRARAAIVGWDKKFSLVKINPLANWTKQVVWKFIMDHDIPYNPLHDQGYMSIGCWPCTRPVLFGEDERAGRWSGTAKTECGLHTENDSPDNGGEPVSSELSGG